MLTIGKIWNISYTVEIGATIGAVALLLGTLLGVSTKNYYEEEQTQMFNEDLLKDMLGYEEVLHEQYENVKYVREYINDGGYLIMSWRNEIPFDNKGLEVIEHIKGIDYDCYVFKKKGQDK